MMSSLVARLKCFFANCGLDIMVCQDLHTLLNRINDLTGKNNRISTMSSGGSRGNSNDSSSKVITICFFRVRLCDCSVVEWPLSVAMNGDGEWDSVGDSRFWDLGFYGEIENRKEEKLE